MGADVVSQRDSINTLDCVTSDDSFTTVVGNPRFRVEALNQTPEGVFLTQEATDKLDQHIRQLKDQNMVLREALQAITSACAQASETITASAPEIEALEPFGQEDSICDD